MDNFGFFFQDAVLSSSVKYKINAFLLSMRRAFLTMSSKNGNNLAKW